MKDITIFLFTFIFCISTVFASPKINPDTTITLSFPKLPKTLYCKVFGNFPVTMATFHIPADYSPKEKLPLIVWISGGMGSAGNTINEPMKIFGKNRFVLLSLPLFKDSLETLLPDSSNYWNRLFITPADAKSNWKSYKTMIHKTLSLIQNIDKRNIFMGGFSNGGHVTACIINEYGRELMRFVDRFFFIEGGEGLQHYELLKNKPAMYMQGGKSTDWVRPLYQHALDNGAKAEFVIMEGVGHQFPKENYKNLINWVDANIKK